ncbi:hypothetical protein MHY87_10950 [Microvirga sp. ACRRW]|uniref:hypothetical protein n=1 Tax=Microvirga sp. ACRRW TaxID=2918205 RepID=UPI001EF63720|nr:hypothetical protein [Microvirga sp. ACRRW]MCG7393423.1 hypothetical protein [Microvirga sp. ACRRW]
MPKMKVAVFVEPGRIVLDEKSIPDVGPLDGFLAGLSDHTIRTTLCPGGKERMRRLMGAL